MKIANWENLLHITSDNNTFRPFNKIFLKITAIIRFYNAPVIVIAERITFIVAITLIGQLVLLWIDLIRN